MAGALLLPLARVSGLAGPVGASVAMVEPADLAAPLVPEVLARSWSLDAVEPIAPLFRAQPVGEGLFVRKGEGLRDDELPHVMATTGGGVDQIPMAPAIAERLSDLVGSVRHVPSSATLNSDMYVADLAADPSQKIAIKIMDTEDFRTTNEVRAHRTLALAHIGQSLAGVFAPFEVDVFPESTFFLLPVADGNLQDDLRSAAVSQASDIFALATDVLHGLASLEDAGIVHGQVTAESIVRAGGRWYIRDLTGSCSTTGIGPCCKKRRESDAWSFFGLVRRLLQKASDASDSRRKLLAVIASFESQRDLSANDALNALVRFALANRLEVRAPKAMVPPPALFRVPSYSQRHPNAPVPPPQPRDDGQPLYPELYEKYVQPWRDAPAASEAH